MRAKRETITTCGDCGNPSVPHNGALWTTSEDSYCTKCRPKMAEEAITALRAEVERLREALIGNAASLAAAISLLERGGKKTAPSDKMFSVMLDDYRKALAEARADLAQSTEQGEKA